MQISVRSQNVAQYVLLPGIMPRLRNAFGFGFSFLAFGFANCFDMVRLLPRDHPYLNPANYGTYSILSVFRAASANVRFEWKHIDQVVMFFALLTAFVVFIGMFATAALYAFMAPAHAAMPTTVAGLMASIYDYTDTPFPQQDVALLLLDRVLGVTGDTASGTFFGSDANSMCPGMQLGAAACGAIPAFPTPVHIAMHNLLRFYSFAMLGFAAITLCYFIAVLIYETNITGIPMGSRFNRFWMPLRLVMALGMLIPTDPHGLNTAQYIVLYTAKVASAFATNGWIYYNEQTQTSMLSGGVDDSNPIGAPVTYTYDPLYGPTIVGSSPLAAKLNAPDVGDLVRFLHLVFSCEYYEEHQNPGVNVQGYFVTKKGGDATPAYTEPADKSGATGTFPTYQDALTEFEYGTINIVFGVMDGIKYQTYPGHVLPLCGSLAIPVTSANNPATPGTENPGAALANELYYTYVMTLMDRSGYSRELMDGFAAQMMENYAFDQGNSGPFPGCIWDNNGDWINEHPYNGVALNELGDCREDPKKTYLLYQIEIFQTVFQALVNSANAELSDPKYWKISTAILNRGWAGAGIWINTVATLNGNFVSSVQQVPYGATLPTVMQNAQTLAQMGVQNLQNYKFDFKLPADQKNPMKPAEIEEAKALSAVYQYVYGDGDRYSFRRDPSGPPGVSGIQGYPIVLDNKQRNPIIDAINIVLGSQFLFTFRDNPDTHPLAQLVTFGRTLLERSARNLMTGSAIASMGGVVSLGNEDIGSGLKKTSAFFFTVASLFFSAGFMLYYVLPMLPFIYFFFSMLSWVKAIFEALIGAPLWAVAHLRLKGQGLPSSASIGGYLLLVEIFLRPIVTVFGLIAALAIFSSSVYVLNDLFNFVVSNVTGNDWSDFASPASDTPNIFVKGSIDQLFYSVLYVVLIYMFANSCFQLIDKIPNSFMQWFGGGMKSFSAEAYRRDNPADRFISNASIAVMYPAQGLISGLGGTVADVAEAAAKTADDASRSSGKTGIAEMVQSSLGKDRNTRINDTIGDMADRYRSSSEEATNLEKRLAKAIDRGDQAEVNRLTQKAKEARTLAEANNVNLLLDELSKPGSSKMSPMARTIAADNLEKLQKVRSMTQDLLETGGTLRMGSGPSAPPVARPQGLYADQKTVADAIKELFEYSKSHGPHKK